MKRIKIPVEVATPENVAPFGCLVAADERVGVFATWPGTKVFGSTALELGSGGEMLLVDASPRPFPVQCGLIERHPRHTQTYLPFNGKPFVMLLGAPTAGDLPDFDGLKALLFAGSGLVMHADVWHDFPYALEDNTQFVVLLRQEAHLNTNDQPEHDMDADGPDLQRRAVRPRAEIFTTMPND